MSLIVYDYHCDECDHTYPDMFVKRAERDEQVCECGAQLRRMMPGPITTFKFHDRSATKSRKSVSLRDPQGGASPKGHSKSLD